jgi:DNA repair protein RadD
MALRDYQQEAFDATIKYIKECYDPCLLELATGAGKSHIVAAIAEYISGKGKVLCLAPSKELTEQNHSKYLSTGNPASFFSASISKSLRHNVVFGTPKTVLNSIDRFGKEFVTIVIDEAHGITPTIKQIVIIGARGTGFFIVLSKLICK